MRELAVQGLGAALLPCFLGDVSPALIRLTPPLPELETGLWILTHSDLRRSLRVRAFMDFAGAEIAKQRRLIEGADGEDAIARGPSAGAGRSEGRRGRPRDRSRPRFAISLCPETPIDMEPLRSAAAINAVERLGGFDVQERSTCFDWRAGAAPGREGLALEACRRRRLHRRGGVCRRRRRACSSGG